MLAAAFSSSSGWVQSLAMSSQGVGSRGPKEPFECSDLAKEWEAEVEIRDHLRQEGHTLFEEGFPESIKNACKDVVFQALEIMCIRTAEKQGHPQAPVGPLREELELLYKKCGAQVSENVSVNDSWCLRKFMCFIKMKVRKAKVSTAPCLYQQICNFNHCTRGCNLNMQFCSCSKGSRLNISR